MIQDALEFRGCLRPGTQHQIRLSAQVDRRESGDEPQLVRSDNLKFLDRLGWPRATQLDGGLTIGTSTELMRVCSGLAVADSLAMPAASCQDPAAASVTATRSAGS